MKNPFENSSIRYAVAIQNILFGILGLSLGILPILGLMVDPLEFGQVVWIFWVLVWLVSFCVISYMQFWWFFSYKAQLIYTDNVHQMLLRAAVWSSMLIYLGVLLQTSQLNLLNILVLLLLTAFYAMYSGKN